MTDHMRPGDGTDDRPYLPAMGSRGLLRFYDPFTRLMGQAAVHRELVGQAELRPGQRVVEIGCGTGSLLLRVRRRHPDVELAGLDPDPEALDRARRKLDGRGPAVRLDRGFADALPYPDASVDSVLSSFMWHHLDPADKPTVLQEVRRVLRPGGRLHLMDMTTTPTIHRVLSRGVHHHPVQHSHDRPAVLSAALREAGFHDVAVTERTRWHLGLHAYYRARR